MKNSRFNMTTLILFLFIFICLSCSDDCNCPTCPEESISDYNIYIYNGAYGFKGINVYNTKLRQLTDFYPLTEDLSDFAISADGSKLLITTSRMGDPNNLIIFNLPQMDTVAVLNVEHYIEVSNSGAYIAVLDDSLTFLDGYNFNILFTDTVKTAYGRFLQDDSRYYTLSLENYNEIRVYDMPGESLLTTYQFHDPDSSNPTAWLLQPTQDEEKIFLKVIFGSRYRHYLISYYPEIDSIGLRFHLGPGMGELRSTPDGSQLICTDPGNIYDEMGSSNIYFINPETDRFISTVPGLYSVPDSVETHFDPNSFAITPDSKYALFTPGLGYLSVIFTLVDLQSHKFVDFEIHPYDSIIVVHAECQKLL